MTRRRLAPVALFLEFTLVVALCATARGAAHSVIHLPATHLTASAADWPTYHHDNTRAGVDSSSSAFSSVGSAWSTSLSGFGEVFAEPLVYGGEVYVVTEEDWFFQLNAATGHVDWSIHLATPFTGSLPCSNNPPGGITGTPAIDPATNMLFAAGQYDNGGSPDFLLWAINLAASPHPALVYSVGIEPPGLFSSQGERGALAIANGRVYVPYGGRDGDCTPYSGFIASVRESDGGGLTSYQTPTSGGAGMWGASGPAVDGSGYVYDTTGNAGCPSTFDFNDAIIKLPALLGNTPTDYFAPSDWMSTFSCPDADLGSEGPMFVGGGYLFQSGKTGDGFLVAPNAMGHIGGEIFRGTACNSSSFGGTAYSAPYIFVPCMDGLHALQQSADNKSFTSLWNFSSGWAGAPIVAGGAVWFVDVNSGTLYALDLATGNQRFSASVGSVHHFITPAASSNMVFVPASTAIVAFRLSPSCSSAGLAASATSPAEVGTSITLTASSTGCAGTPSYDFFMLPPGGSWVNLSGGYTSSTTFMWNTAGLKLGTYSLDVYVRGSGSTAAYDNFGLLPFVLTGCQSATMSPSATQQSGSGSVSFTVTPAGCTSSLRQLWYLGPSGVWKNTGAYAAGASVSFPASTLPAGNYSLAAWVKDTSSPNQYDTYALATYQVGSGCTPATIASSGGSSLPVGGGSTFTATTSGCTTPSYQWWLLPPSGSWQLKQTYGSGTWAPTFGVGSYEPGTYSVDAWVKQSGSAAAYNTYGLYSLTLTTCAAATLAAAPASPQAAGTSITLTATSTGCATPEYQFWVLPPGGSWMPLGQFSTTNTATWTSSAPGNYAIVVWVRPQGSPDQYATYGMTSFTLQ